MNRTASPAREKPPRTRNRPASEDLEGVLAPEETLLWSGRPDPVRTVFARAGHALFGVAALLVLGFTPAGDLLSSLLPPSEPAQLFHPLVTGAVLALAVYGFIALFRVYWKTRRTVYALTDRRVVQVLCGEVEKSAALDEIEARCHGNPDEGWGDVLFSTAAAVQPHALPCPRGFFGVADAQDVYRRVLRARQDHARTKTGGVHDYLDFLLQAGRPEGPAGRDRM